MCFTKVEKVDFDSIFKEKVNQVTVLDLHTDQRRFNYSNFVLKGYHDVSYFDTVAT